MPPHPKKLKQNGPNVSLSFSQALYRAIESQFEVDNKNKYKAMVAMTTALPNNLQQLRLCDLGSGHKYCDGEDPDPDEHERTANWTTHNIQMISKFRKLQRLKISASMNGRYPVLFNFPLLEVLEIRSCCYLKWDLDMLAGLPSLKELSTSGSCECLTGNIRSLRTLKNTLEKVRLSGSKIEGDFMDLAGFPRLKSLNLRVCPQVTGDIREIGESDFALLEELDLESPVIGAICHKFQRTSDVPSVAEAIYRLNQRDKPLVKRLDNVYWQLSCDSPEWYAKNGESVHPPPPFSIKFVQAGSASDGDGRHGMV